MSKRVLLTCFVAIALIGSALVCFAADKIKRVQDKIERVKYGINEKSKAGQDTGPAFNLLKQAKNNFDSGKFDKGEADLDAALTLLGSPQVQIERNPKELLPSLEIGEEFSDLYIMPEEVQIEGNDKDCMEPMISRDGQYLFFNDSNAPNVDTHIHMCKRIGDNKFKDLGILPGSKSAAKDMAPTMDSAGRIYFTSTKSYDQDLNTLFSGQFLKENLNDVKPITGDIRPKIPGWLNMDCCISADGTTLIVSRARFEAGAHVPVESDLILANLKDGSFQTDPSSKSILATINTPALEYAPELTEDNLRLFFTRAFEITRANGKKEPVLRIMFADRTSTSAPFGKPKSLSAIQGFVEAPTLSTGGKELYFHKQVRGHNRIFRVRKK